MSVGQRYGLFIRSLGRFPFLIPFAVFSLICIIYAVPLLKNPTYWGEMDWDQFVFWNAVPRLTILKYHQFPLWNPYSNGGNVMLALPHSSFLSPMFIFVLLFGPVVGLKLQWIVSIFIGLLGMFFLSRHYKMAPISQYLAPVVFMLSSTLTLHLAEGHVEFLALAFLPWFFLFAIQAHQNKKFLLLSVLFLSFMVLSGIYAALFTVIFSAIYFMAYSIYVRKGSILFSLASIFLLTCLVCSVKLVPVLMFLKDHPRRIESRERVEATLLARIFTDRDQGLIYQQTKRLARNNMAKVGKAKLEYGWQEYGAFVGYIPLLLALIGILFDCRRHWPLIAANVMILWISLGAGAFYNLWGLIHRFPVYDSLHVPSRFLPWIVFTISLLSGLGLSRIEGISPKPYLKILLGFVIIFVSGDLWLVSYPLLRNTFTINPPKVVSSEFRQRHSNFNLLQEKSNSSMYPAFLSNSGVIDSYDIANVKSGEVRLWGDPDYRGEAFFLDDKNTADVVSFSPNRITVRARVQEAASLILNQNFYKGWRIAGFRGRVDPYAGLASVYLPPGDHWVTFYYLPNSFILGATLTGLMILMFTTMFPKHSSSR